MDRAIEASQSLIECNLPLKSSKIEKYILKYKGKLGIGKVNPITSKQILNKALRTCSTFPKERYYMGLEEKNRNF